MVGAFLYWTVVITLLLKWINPPTSSFMVQAEAIAWWNNEDIALTYEWADWDRISPYVKVAAITSEDQNFPRHWGFDFGAIEKALEDHQKGRGLRGASTITQQVAKNLFLWPAESFIRKGIEAYLTLLIELFWTKKRILEVYLNIAQFGNGVFGVQAASKTYFQTSADELNMIQSSLMITALPSPRRYNLGDPSPYMIERRNWILVQMLYLGNTRYLDKLEEGS